MQTAWHSTTEEKRTIHEKAIALAARALVQWEASRML